MSQEYISALVILVVGLSKIFGFQIGSDAISGIITGALAIWIAIRRYQRGDISASGLRK